MFVDVAATLARQLMNQYGLEHWVFELDRAKRRAGLCSYRRKTISLSEHYVINNEPLEIIDTILHEVAHALVGPGHHHNRIWQAKAIELGARPERCYSESVVMPTGRYTAVCPSCSKVFHAHRRPKNVERWCIKCGRQNGQIRYQLNVELIS